MTEPLYLDELCSQAVNPIMANNKINIRNSQTTFNKQYGK